MVSDLNYLRSLSDSDLSIVSHDSESFLDYIDIIQDNFYRKYKNFPYYIFNYHINKIIKTFKLFLKNKRIM